MIIGSVVALMVLTRVSVGQNCPFTPIDDLDFMGGDMPGQPVSKQVATPEECASLCCTAGPDCVAFSLNAGEPGKRWCYLKKGGWTNASIAHVQSGMRPPPAPAHMPWFNITLSRGERLSALLTAMTIDEKISWLDDSSPAIKRLGIPAYSWEAEALHGVAWSGVATIFPENIAWGASFDTPLVEEMADVIAVEARAKWIDGIKEDGSSAEFAGLSFMTPNNNLFVDPRWGRGQETYGEDPVLTAEITHALIRRLQFGDDPTYNKMIAVSKHWLGYHIESWDGQKQYRLSHSYNYSDTDLQQYYLVPFAAAVRANVTAVMCGYDGQNGSNPEWPHPGGTQPWGVPMCLHPNIQHVLRDQLAFQGYVISDDGAITFAGPKYHNYTPTVTDAACLAMNAGTDLALGGEYGKSLRECVSHGRVTEDRVDEALRRTLTAQFQIGWFDTLAAMLHHGGEDPVPYNRVSVKGNVSTPAHRALSRRAAEEGLVLLKNANSTLPLSSQGLRKVALLGPAADYTAPRSATSSYIGNYSPCQDSPGGALIADPRCHVVTLLEALGARAKADGWALSHSPGCDINTPNQTGGFAAAVAAAAGADVIVAAVGLDTCQETACSEGEANDRLATLDLPGSQLQLLQTVHAAHPSIPLVVVLLNGGPISSPWAFGTASAVLEAWYPGYEGGNAIADALMGAFSPAGRLPITIVRDLHDLPLYTDTVLSTPPGRTHRYFTRPPLFPFGFGLSYASFSYAGLTIEPPILSPSDDFFRVGVDLSHVRGMTSDEVVQVYGSFQAHSSGRASVPLQQLLAYTRVHNIRLGDAKKVSFEIPRAMLALVSPNGTMGVSAGKWVLSVGGGPPLAPYFGGAPVVSGVLVVN